MADGVGGTLLFFHSTCSTGPIGYCFSFHSELQWLYSTLYPLFAEKGVWSHGTRKEASQKREPRPKKDPALRNKMYRYRLYHAQAAIAGVDCAEVRSYITPLSNERTAAYRMAGVSVNYEMQAAQLPEIKEDRPEYQEIFSQVLQDVLRRIDTSMQNFFRRVKDWGSSWIPALQIQ